MSNKETPLLVLLDTHAIIHRSYHALPDFASPEGEPTGALYGLILMLLSLIEKFNPTHVAACYDLPGKTFRHEAYEDYKKGRKAADDALIAQIKRSKDIIKALAIPIYQCEGFEADDMLGTIVEQTKEKDINIVIASGDMDTMQLVVRDKVQVFTLRKGIKDTVTYNEEAVLDRFTFAPKYLTDYKGLSGDNSDNIIGIKGIGDKTAKTLISNFGTIENIYKILEQNEEKLKEAGIKTRIINLLKEGKDDALFSKELATIRTDAPITFNLKDTEWGRGVDLDSLLNLFHTLGFRSIINRTKKLLGFEEEDTNNTPINESDTTSLTIAVWLLNSEKTNPTIEDVYNYAGTTNIQKAKDTILKEIKTKDLTNVYEKIELPLVSIIKKMEDRGVLLDTEKLKTLSKEIHTRLDKIESKIHELAGTEFNVRSPKQLVEVLFEKLEIPTTGVRKTPSGAYSTKESELEKLVDRHPIIKEILNYRELHKLSSTYIDPLPKLVDKNNRLHAKFLQTGTSTGRFSSTDPNLQNIPGSGDIAKQIRNAFISSEGYSLVALDYSQVELRCAAIMANDEYMIDAFQKGQDIHAAVASKMFNVDQDKVTKDMRRQAKVINFGVLYGMGVTALQQNLKTTRKEAQAFYNNYFEQFSSIRDYMDSVKDFAYQNGYTKTLFGRRRYVPALSSRVPFIQKAAERAAINAPIQGTATADIIKLAMIHVDKLIKKNKWDKHVHMIMQIHDEIVFEIKDDLVKEITPQIKQTMEGVLKNSYLDYDSPVPLKVDYEIGKRWGDIK